MSILLCIPVRLREGEARGCTTALPRGDLAVRWHSTVVQALCLAEPATISLAEPASPARRAPRSAWANQRRSLWPNQPRSAWPNHGRSLTPVRHIVAVRERVAAIVAAFRALPSDQQALLAGDGEPMSVVAQRAGLGSVRTAWRRAATARDTLLTEGITRDEIEAVIPYLPAFDDVERERSPHHLDSITRAMTPEEMAGYRAGYAVGRTWRTRAGALASRPRAGEDAR